MTRDELNAIVDHGTSQNLIPLWDLVDLEQKAAELAAALTQARLEKSEVVANSWLFHASSQARMIAVTIASALDN